MKPTGEVHDKVRCASAYLPTPGQPAELAGLIVPDEAARASGSAEPPTSWRDYGPVYPGQELSPYERPTQETT